jgi:tetratricopeptide (TPR) repeat protein
MASVRRLIGWLRLRRVSWLTPVLTVLLTLAPWGGVAQAQETQDVSVERLRREVNERLVQDGNQAVHALSFERATYVWALAYAVSPDPAMLLNMAEACRNGGRPREAYALFQRFLQEDPGTARKAEIEAQSRLLLAGLGDPANVRAMRLAQEHVQLGVVAYGRQDYNEAIREFTLAYALSPTPDLLYNLANSQRKADAAAEALLLYERYLKSTNSTTQRSSAEAYRSQMVIALRHQAPVLPKVVDPPSVPEPSTPPAEAPAIRTPAPVPPAVQPVVPLARSVQRTLSYVELVLGPILGSRFLRATGDAGGPCQVLVDFQTNRYWPGDCPQLTVPVTPGLQVGLTLFPLAGRSLRWVQGLGMEAAFELWPTHSLCANLDSSGICTGGAVTATRVRVTAGLRWEVAPWQTPGSARFGIYVRYGFDRQELSADADPTTIRSLPSIDYHYVDSGLSLNVPLVLREKFAIRTDLRIGYLAPLRYGELSTPPAAEPDRPRFGEVLRGHGVRIQATLLDVSPWRGLTLQLIAAYQLMTVQMETTASSGPLPVFQVSRIDDHRLCTGIQVGYRY